MRASGASELENVVSSLYNCAPSGAQNKDSRGHFPGSVVAIIARQPNASFTPNLKMSDILFFSADFSSLGCM